MRGITYAILFTVLFCLVTAVVPESSEVSARSVSDCPNGNCFIPVKYNVPIVVPSQEVVATQDCPNGQCPKVSEDVWPSPTPDVVPMMTSSVRYEQPRLVKGQPVRNLFRCQPVRSFFRRILGR